MEPRRSEPDAAKPGVPASDAPTSDAPTSDAQEFIRRRRGRNYALFAVLLALVVLFYAITILKRAGLQ